VSHNRIVIKKGTAILVAVAILALGVIGTSLSTLYKQNEYIGYPPMVTFKESYGFPLGWHGYSVTEGSAIPVIPPPLTYWFSLESLLLDAAFWFAISFFACVATMKSVKVLLRTIASKVVVTYFLASASFSVVGLSLYLFSYENLGLRLLGFGIFLVVATFYQSLAGERKTSQKDTRRQLWKMKFP
jgi:hypothetical protein